MSNETGDDERPPDGKWTAVPIPPPDVSHDASGVGTRIQLTDPLLSEIGSTPMIPYEDAALEGSMHVKCEFDNPTGSMKDRVAYGMITELEAAGDISTGDLLVEASSGNTAGAVALVANRLGYEAIITAPVDTSPQKLGYVEAFGAELVRCPSVSPDDDRHYRAEAARLADARGGVLLDQYTNQSNPRIHAEWTGPELVEHVPDLTHVVAPMGTGGTMSGIAKYVKEYDDSVTTVGVDAVCSNISAVFEGTESGPHETEIEGLGQDEELPTMWFEYIDDVRSVSDDDAFAHARRAARTNGLLLGGSSGGALAVARELALTDPDATVVTVACDGGEQYFDTVFDEEWLLERGFESDGLE